MVSSSSRAICDPLKPNWMHWPKGEPLSIPQMKAAANESPAPEAETGLSMCLGTSKCSMQISELVCSLDLVPALSLNAALLSSSIKLSNISEIGSNFTLSIGNLCDPLDLRSATKTPDLSIVISKHFSWGKWRLINSLAASLIASMDSSPEVCGIESPLDSNSWHNILNSTRFGLKQSSELSIWDWDEPAIRRKDSTNRGSARQSVGSKNIGTPSSWATLNEHSRASLDKFASKTRSLDRRMSPEWLRIASRSKLLTASRFAITHSHWPVKESNKTRAKQLDDLLWISARVTLRLKSQLKPDDSRESIANDASSSFPRAVMNVGLHPRYCNATARFLPTPPTDRCGCPLNVTPEKGGLLWDRYGIALVCVDQ